LLDESTEILVSYLGLCRGGSGSDGSVQQSVSEFVEQPVSEFVEQPVSESDQQSVGQVNTQSVGHYLFTKESKEVSEHFA
jgi:hypothetical protein